MLVRRWVEGDQRAQDDISRSRHALRQMRAGRTAGGLRNRRRRVGEHRSRDQAGDRSRRGALRRGAPSSDRRGRLRSRGGLMAAVVETPERVRLELEGMTCTSCAARIERKLNKLEGVEATVNFATEEAAVSFDPTRTSLEDLVGAVEAAGYGASLGADAAETEDATRQLRLRLIVAAVLTAPLTALAMIPPLQFDGWEWLALALATPVVLWSGFRFHRAAALNLRHGAATMDTLISLGTLAALSWSLVALLFFSDPETYFEVGAVTTTLVLLGRYFEARARRRSSAAIRALLELVGAKDARLLRDGRELLVPVDELRVGDRFLVRPGEKVA